MTGCSILIFPAPHENFADVLLSKDCSTRQLDKNRRTSPRTEAEVHASLGAGFGSDKRFAPVLLGARRSKYGGTFVEVTSHDPYMPAFFTVFKDRLTMLRQSCYSVPNGEWRRLKMFWVAA